MPRPRKSLICLQDTPYYHCVSRCVRRAYLCGHDEYSGQSYEHRRNWVEKRLLHLSMIFSIDICAYAVMSNHTHIVMCVDQEKAKKWTNEEVLLRWHKLFKGTVLTRQFLEQYSRAKMSEAEIKTVLSTINIYRKRLIDISWFMRLLNEYIARKANKEDDCTGRFWEGRFKSQALLDESALLACMAYVDLNPIRANIARHIVSSRYTSIHNRIVKKQKGHHPSNLMPFREDINCLQKRCIPISLYNYIKLLEETSRKQHQSHLPAENIVTYSFIRDAGFTEMQWHKATTHFEKCYGNFVGKEAILRTK